MFWICPACGKPLQHIHEELRAGLIYQCNICDVELIFDPRSRRLLAALRSS
jgi:hypothetical protein